MSLDALTRTFPFRVRPLRDETVASLSRRVLEANGEPGDLPRYLLAAHALPKDDWAAVLHTKNRSRPAPRPTDAGVRHIDGTTCRQCTDLLIPRWMCTLCAHGAHVEQEPHFRSPVCIRHSRWTGFDIEPTQQHRVPGSHVEAARRFDTLRRKGRIDPRLYGVTSQHLLDELGATEEDVFPIAVGLIADITAPGFLRSLLDPRRTYRQAYRMLAREVTRHGGGNLPETTRALWLVLRPVFAAARAAARTGTPFTAGHPHDFPVHPAAVTHMPVMRDREPFTVFLDQTHDTPLTASQHLGKAYQRLIPGTRTRHHVCRHGHEFTRNSDNPTPRCPECPRHGAATPGVNDIASQAPHLLREWDWDRNMPLTPTMVAVSSSDRVHWLCSKGHSFPATANNRSNNDQGCPYCKNRRILPGFNDFATRYPKKFAELAPRACLIIVWSTRLRRG